MLFLPGSTAWRKINHLWLEKIYINNRGIPVFTYHYKTRTGKPCFEFEIDTRISRQVCGYTLIEKDLRDTLGFLDIHLNLFNNTKSKESELLLKALTRAIVITYGKCFAKADGRKIKLEDKIISQKNISMHLKLMEMRNEYVAHAGESEYESCKSIYLISPETKYKRGQEACSLYCNDLRQLSAPPSFFEYKSLIEEIHAYVKDKIEYLKMKVEDEFDGIIPEEFYELSKNRSHRITLNEKDLLRMKRANDKGHSFD